ncbi:MAG: hypothetical protein J6039_02520 [Alphaproteobacteria bacterium]|nr:hypothetical protein [Alphaproteobacteria bacterium]
MKKLNINIGNLTHLPYGGLLLLSLIVVVMFFLCYVLLRNPYKGIHEQVFITADKIRSYYRDQPGYWKLSTQTAKDNNLISPALLKHQKFDIQVGQGINGEAGTPGIGSFNIALSNLNKSSCISLAELKTDKQQLLALLRIAIVNQNGTTEFTWGADKPLPMTRQASREICQPTGNTLVWTFQ